MRYDLRLGDCMDVMPLLPENSIDSCVTDPPYHLTSIVKRFGGANAAPAKFGTDGAFARASAGFMGKQWDGGDIAFRPETWAAVLRILKPGANLVAFSATRRYHRMACAIEDAGFEILDQIAWAYGSGMPKSHSAGEGRGTALKPAWEPIVWARKPLSERTIMSNIRKWGTGFIMIDGCRVPVSDADARDVGREITRNVRPEDGWGFNSKSVEENVAVLTPKGRWPANFIHDGSDEVLALFPAAAGQQAPVYGNEPSASTGAVYRAYKKRAAATPHDFGGSAARFFYCAKASKQDREEGCEHLPYAVLARSNLAQSQEANGDVIEEGGEGFNAARKRRNNHPTVKPTPLMAYLCRLMTPPGGIVLDPFMGSGSTGKGAMLAGLRFTGIERDGDYMKIATARVEFGARKYDRDTAQGSLLAA